MDFSVSERQKLWRDRVVAFMDAHVYPAVETYDRQDHEGERWKVIPILEQLKAKAKAEGLWNLFLPPSLTHDEGDYPRRRIDQPRLRTLRRADGAGVVGIGSLQLLGTGYRQHGSFAPLRFAGAKGQVAQTAAQRRNPLGVSDDRTRRGIVRRHQYRNLDCPRTAATMSSTAANGGHRASAIRAARSRS